MWSQGEREKYVKECETYVSINIYSAYFIMLDSEYRKIKSVVEHICS
jgi:hypothetical protein